MDPVIETPTTVTLNDRRLVFGGGVSGMARSVSTTGMLPLGPLEVPDSIDPPTPLHEIIKQATASSQKDNNFLSFIQFSTTELC